MIFGPDFHQGAPHGRFSRGTETRCMLKNLHVLNKHYLTCIPREHKPLGQLTRLDDFTINAIANLYIHERLKILEAYSETSQTSEIVLFAKIVNGYKSLTISTKSFILDVRLGSEKSLHPSSQELDIYS